MEGPMLKEERQQAILELVRQDGKVLVVDLITRLNVSEDTIRRDLNDLTQIGFLQRGHGGALPRAPDLPFDQRIRETDSTKKATAEAATRLLQERQVGLLVSGS